MKTEITILPIILLLSCEYSNNETTPVSPTTSQHELNTRDTCLRILTAHALEDSYTYTRLYDKQTYGDVRLSYVKTGPFIHPSKKSGVLIYTPSDKSIAIELYSFEKGKWLLTDKKTQLATNGLIFYTAFKDYNFDLISDIYINVCVSNGSGLSTGHLLTVSKDGQLIEHPETENIRDMEPDSVAKIVKAKYPLGCLNYKTICDLSYKWVDNRLCLQGKLCECKN